MSHAEITRRTLHLRHFDDVRRECQALLGTEYARAGNWSLAQVCQHLRLTIEANMHGYPTWMTALGLPLRPILRVFVLPRLLEGKSVQGVRTAARFVPPDHLDDRNEVALLETCMQEFARGDGPLHAHPGFGMMSRDRFEQFHAAHAAHHLAFLVPAGS